MLNKYAVVIPTYEPTEGFYDVIKGIREKFQKVIIVNDGSGSEYDYKFEKVQALGVVYIYCEVNRGKGAALKEAFQYILDKQYADGVITADSDGQHTVSDIILCGEASAKNPDKLILGVRDFDQGNVPKKSEFGNKLTRTILKTFYHLNITDSQTGLRAFSVEVMKKIMLSKGDRFEYETNMLIDVKRDNIDILERKIETIYFENNEGTHFNPIRDSLKIYGIFLKYIASSISSFALDYLLFVVIFTLMNGFDFENVVSITVATISARIISSLFNYSVNKKLVFNDKSKNSIYRYFTLVIFSMLLSNLSVVLLSSVFGAVAAMKLIADGLIFLFNYQVQKYWVYRGGKG